MPSYLLELYLSKASSVQRASEIARRVAKAGTLECRALRYVRTLFVAEDETCFHVFEAPSRDALVEAAQRAGLGDARVTEAIQSEDEGREQPG